MSLDRYDAPNEPYTSSIPPGTRAFREECAKAWGFTLAQAQVIRDRDRCPPHGPASEHCPGRAVDFMTRDRARGRAIFDWCVTHSAALGIQSVIHWRRVVGFGNPRERAYTGKHSHEDHVHVGLNRWAAQNLTREMVRSRLQPTPTPAPAPPAPVPDPEEEPMTAFLVRVTGRPHIYYVSGTRRIHVLSPDAQQAFQSLGLETVELPAEQVRRFELVGGEEPPL